MTRATLLCSLLSLLAVAACKPKKVFRPVGPGVVQDNVWRNEDLGLELTLPKGWAIQNEEQKKQLMAAGAEVVSGDDEQLNAEFEAGSKRTISLFSAFEKPVGSTLTFNPSIIGIAENLFAIEGVQTPEDYFAETKKLLTRSRGSAARSSRSSTRRCRRRARPRSSATSRDGSATTWCCSSPRTRPTSRRPRSTHASRSSSSSRPPPKAGRSSSRYITPNT